MNGISFLRRLRGMTADPVLIERIAKQLAEANARSVERAWAVVAHWRRAADDADRADAEVTAALPGTEDQPIVTYVPASDALRLSAARLESALLGKETA